MNLNDNADKALETQAPETKENQTHNSLERLNTKQRLFLMLLLERKKVIDAYKLAGYEGQDPNAAYVLKSRLSAEYELLVKEASGSTKADLMQKLGFLTELPVKNKDGSPLEYLTPILAIRAIAEQAKLLKDDKPPLPQLTMISIKRYDSKPQTINIEKSNVIEADTLPTEKI